MTKEIISRNEFVKKEDGRRFLIVEISNEALSQINKIVLGDQVDEDNRKHRELRNQVHEDCLELFKEFN